MNHAMNAPAQMVPSTTILTNWVEQDWNQCDGVQVETLNSMDRVLVRTFNSVYEVIIETGRGDVLVRGGRFFQEFTCVYLAGSSLGGSFLKQLGIYVGLRMELVVDGETILTSPVRAISVCPLETPADRLSSH
jgi:hypothetical protein